MPYISAWRARERLWDTLDGDEGASFKLIPSWIEQVKIAQGDSSYATWQASKEGNFEALFVVFGPINTGIQKKNFFAIFD